MEHSVLGDRWIYNACSDPVYVAELVRTIIEGDASVEAFVETADGMVPRPATAPADGTGAVDLTVPLIESVTATTTDEGTRVTAGSIEVLIRHDLREFMTDRPALIARWGQGQQAVVAVLS
ncbi:MAG: hypothetical protein R2706_14645 [Acidimicrobiales bacterium]